MKSFTQYVERELLPDLVTDIGSSLGGSLSATQALLNGAVQDSELRRDLLGGIDGELRYLRFLFENWILFRTMQTGKIKLALRQVNPAAWLRSILAPWQGLVPEKKLRWQVRIARGLPQIEVDPDRLAQGLGNLLYAGICSAPVRSLVLLEAGVSGEFVKISLCDSGVALSDRVLPGDSTEPLLSGSESHPRLRKGLGLGILLAHRVVQAHQGLMRFEERPDFKSCVSVYLPV